jgi:hypothetical protein
MVKSSMGVGLVAVPSASAGGMAAQRSVAKTTAGKRVRLTSFTKAQFALAMHMV